MLALRGARLFDGRAATRLEQPVVVTDGGRVVGVEQGSPELPEGTEILDLGDVTLLPGLVDSHVHLGLDATLSAVPGMVAADDAMLLERMAEAARASLRAGVTTVRDLGDRAYLAIALRDRLGNGALGPEILASGPPLTTPRGHCHFMGGGCAGEDDLRRAVRDHVAGGVDVVKVMGTGGVLTAETGPLTPQFSEAELRAVVDEAHGLAVTVTVHAHGLQGIELAVAAGADGIEHCGFWVEEGVRADEALIARIAERGIVVCPTMGMAGSFPPPPPVASRMDGLLDATRRMHRAGVTLLGGTDAGVGPAKPHGGTAYAVAHLADAGLSPVECLRAATSVAAEALGLAGRKGVLAPGADADVLAVGGDPLADPAALLDVRAVFRAGVRVPL